MSTDTSTILLAMDPNSLEELEGGITTASNAIHAYVNDALNSIDSLYYDRSPQGAAAFAWSQSKDRLRTNLEELTGALDDVKLAVVAMREDATSRETDNLRLMESGDQ